MKTDHTLTSARLRALMVYVPATGELTWRRSLPGHRIAGHVAGYPAGTKGRVQIEIDGTPRYAHRLVWLYHHGVWPTTELDHVNNNKHDNRIENLREATTAQNAQNRHNARVDNQSGLLGVSWDRRNGKYRARIMVSGRSVSLGNYTTPEDAHAAYLEAKRTHHPFWSVT